MLSDKQPVTLIAAPRYPHSQCNQQIVAGVLPILVANLLAREGQLVIVEQPELHLHPEAQASLADFFVELCKNGKKVLLETHSEHMLLRLQRRIAEMTLQHLETGVDTAEVTRKSSTDWIQIAFVNRDDALSTVEGIHIDVFGELIAPSVTFRKFFSQDYQDVKELTVAAAKARLNIEVKHVRVD